ncbi:MAG TPA: helix-turn-helix domain-containing protein [Acidimicrobiia bacterium]|jgi:DeoR family suf operon transcriptional repressor|nr:helix-turn-helix domain-containing protein [Acidimicrobiia bacterium]
MTARPSPQAPPAITESRRSLLYALRRRGEATAEQLAEQLGVTLSGVRQLLSALQDDGLVESVAATKTGRGRRPLVYSLTPRADTLFPKAYGELTNELLDYVADTDQRLVDDVFARRRDNRVAAAQARLEPKRSLGAKVAELTRILDEDGYLATHERVGTGVWRIVEHNCAIWAVAQRYGQACSSELDFIRTVLPDADVERVAHMVAGARHCAYEVRARR